MQRRYRKPRPQFDPIKKFRVNEQIKVPRVFLIDERGQKIGEMNFIDALNQARDAELDLVEVSPLINPPVVKIMDYGQYRYETEKKIRKAKAHQKIAETKAIRLSFRIKGKDLETRKNQALNFLNDGNKVKIDLILKGREKAHRDLAINNLREFIRSLGPEVKTLSPISTMGGQITTTVDK